MNEELVGWSSEAIVKIRSYLIILLWRQLQKQISPTQLNMSLQIKIPNDFKRPDNSDHARALAEHQQSLKKQKLSSVLIAVFIHTLIFLGLALWIIVGTEPEPAEIQVRVNNSPEFKPVTKAETKVSNRKPSPPSPSSKLITTATMSEVFVPQWTPMLLRALVSVIISASVWGWAVLVVEEADQMRFSSIRKPLPNGWLL